MSDGTGQLIAGDGARRWITPAIETIIAAIVVALILVALACAGQSYETNWILIAILPVAFWLFFSGRISTFKAFGVELQADHIVERDAPINAGTAGPELIVFGTEILAQLGVAAEYFGIHVVEQDRLGLRCHIRAKCVAGKACDTEANGNCEK